MKVINLFKAYNERVIFNNFNPNGSIKLFKYMFNGCNALEYIDLTTNKSYNMIYK